MVVVFKDIFYASIPGIDHGQCLLDLYLPRMDTSQFAESADHQLNPTERLTSTYFKDTFNEDWLYSQRKDSSVLQHETFNSETGISNRDTLSPTKQLRGLDETFSMGDKRGHWSVPLVLFIHGGGWRRGARAAWTHYLYFDVNFLVAFLQYFIGTYGNIGETLARNNVACAIVSYPLTEAGGVTLLVEMVVSYLQSVLFVLFVCVPLTGLLFFYRIVSHSCHNSSWELSVDKSYTFGTVTDVILNAMLLTNIINSTLFIVKRRQFGIALCQLRCYCSVIVISFVISIVSSNPSLTLVISTLFWNQSLIFYRRLQRHGATYEQQVQAVAEAVRWAKSFSRDTGFTDLGRLYLMGHSAGGHLATLSALDESVLSYVSCSVTDLKGVISVSGVYDLLCLNKHVLRPIYLQPTFGRNPATWLCASPQHVARQTIDSRGKPTTDSKSKQTKNSKTMPKFLLMSAEKDLFLRDQSFHFAKTLATLDFDCRHVEIERTNHFNIITNTSTARGSTLSYVLDFVT